MSRRAQRNPNVLARPAAMPWQWTLKGHSSTTRPAGSSLPTGTEVATPA
jgi:hypothetical protein